MAQYEAAQHEEEIDRQADIHALDMGEIVRQVGIDHANGRDAAQPVQHVETVFGIRPIHCLRPLDAHCERLRGR